MESDLDALLDEALEEYEKIEDEKEEKKEEKKKEEGKKEEEEPVVNEEMLKEIMAQLMKGEAEFGLEGKEKEMGEMDAETEKKAAEMMDQFMKALMQEGTGEGSEADDQAAADAVSGLLKPFVAKETLYAPLLEIKKRYPKWLEEHRKELPPKELKEREEQYDVLCRICDIYETQKGPDDRVSDLILLLEKMGQAPPELVEEASASAPGAAANPYLQTGDTANAEPNPEDCLIM